MEKEQRVVNSLALVIDALKLVKTIMIEAEDFWNDQAKFINKTNTEPNFLTTAIGEVREETAEERQKREEDEDEEFFKIGLNWLVCGKLSVLAYEENEKNKKKVNSVFLSHITERKKKEVLDSARSMINDITALHERIKEKNAITSNRMENATQQVISSVAVSKSRPAPPVSSSTNFNTTSEHTPTESNDEVTMNGETDEVANGLVDEATDESVDDSTDEAANESVDEATDEAANEALDEATDDTSNGATDEAADEATDS
jgi:hypothetical protein